VNKEVFQRFHIRKFVVVNIIGESFEQIENKFVKNIETVLSQKLKQKKISS